MSEKIPSVSVIVPNYNYARFLEERLDSILNQDFEDFELILLDDASTDDSAEVIGRYRGDSRVSHVCINAENSGSPFRQWMRGILMARGEYIWIAEADDLADSDFLSSCISQLKKYPDASLCFTGSRLIDERGELIPKDVNHWNGRDDKYSECFRGEDYIVYNLYWKNYIMNASGVVFRRKYALRLEHSEFLDMRYCGDWLFWYQMALQGAVVEIYRNRNYFRQHGGKVTVKAKMTGNGLVETIRIIRLIEKGFPDFLKYKKSLRRGLLFRTIRRSRLDGLQKQKLYALLSDELDARKLDIIRERSNQLLRIFRPGLVTAKRDRL